MKDGPTLLPGVIVILGSGRAERNPQPRPPSPVLTQCLRIETFVLRRGDVESGVRGHGTGHSGGPSFDTQQSRQRLGIKKIRRSWNFAHQIRVRVSWLGPGSPSPSSQRGPIPLQKSDKTVDESNATTKRRSGLPVLRCCPETKKGCWV